MRYEVSNEQRREIEVVRRLNKNKRVENRLRGLSRSYVNWLIADYYQKRAICNR